MTLGPPAIVPCPVCEDIGCLSAQHDRAAKIVLLLAETVGPLEDIDIEYEGADGRLRREHFRPTACEEIK